LFANLELGQGNGGDDIADDVAVEDDLDDIVEPAEVDGVAECADADDDDNVLDGPRIDSHVDLAQKVGTCTTFLACQC